MSKQVLGTLPPPPHSNTLTWLAPPQCRAEHSLYRSGGNSSERGPLRGAALLDTFPPSLSGYLSVRVRLI